MHIHKQTGQRRHAQTKQSNRTVPVYRIVFLFEPATQRRFQKLHQIRLVTQDGGCTESSQAIELVEREDKICTSLSKSRIPAQYPVRIQRSSTLDHCRQRRCRNTRRVQTWLGTRSCVVQLGFCPNGPRAQAIRCTNDFRLHKLYLLPGNES